MTDCGSEGAVIGWLGTPPHHRPRGAEADGQVRSVPAPGRPTAQAVQPAAVGYGPPLAGSQGGSGVRGMVRSASSRSPGRPVNSRTRCPGG